MQPSGRFVHPCCLSPQDSLLWNDSRSARHSNPSCDEARIRNSGPYTASMWSSVAPMYSAEHHRHLLVTNVMFNIISEIKVDPKKLFPHCSNVTEERQ